MLFVGPSGAGKDTVADRISLLTGAEITSLSSQVRKEAHKAGLVNPTRGDLQIFANEMRSVHGNNVFAKLAAEDIANDGKNITIVNGIRHPDEIRVFDSPTIVGVDASIEVRFKRVLERARPSDPKSWEEFLVCDQRENGTPDGKDGQQNYQCLTKANVVIENDYGSLEQLEYVVDLLVDRLVNTGGLKELGRLPAVCEPGQKQIVVTNGPHGAGKTTIGRMLSESMKVPHITEIGGQLRQEVTYNALESSSDFDREVMRRELLRDHELLRDTNSRSFILETWHTGNIAYALQRSPEIFKNYVSEFKKQLTRFEVLHLLFAIDDQSFIQRVTEKIGEGEMGKLLDFYKGITRNTKELYDSLGLKFEEIDNNGDTNIALQKALEVSRTHLQVLGAS